MAGSPTSQWDVGRGGISWGQEGTLFKSHKNEHLVIFYFFFLVILSVQLVPSRHSVVLLGVKTVKGGGGEMLRAVPAPGHRSMSQDQGGQSSSVHWSHSLSPINF